MSFWPSLLQRPEPFLGDETAAAWFNRIAVHLLNGAHLVVGGTAQRLIEIEFYYFGPDHADPFAHRDPVQVHCGRWYFHRTNGVYRGGSFKGLDLSFGDGTAFAGVLFRGLETPEGRLIDGPSLTVDYLLDATGAATVAELDRAISARLAWDATNPLLLREAPGLEQRALLRTARVGLSLKRARGARTDMTSFVMRNYRYLSRPRQIAKGKLHMVLALHGQGHGTQEIQQRTGVSKPAIDRYVADCEAGRQVPDFTPFLGIDLGPKDLCRLHGTWQAHYGTVSTH
jgi:hypothetical protein